MGSFCCSTWHLLVGACEVFLDAECRIFLACRISLPHVGSLVGAGGIFVAACGHVVMVVGTFVVAFRVFLIVAGRIFIVPCEIVLVVMFAIFVVAHGISVAACEIFSFDMQDL